MCRQGVRLAFCGYRLVWKNPRHCGRIFHKDFRNLRRALEASPEGRQHRVKPSTYRNLSAQTSFGPLGCILRRRDLPERDPRMRPKACGASYRPVWAPKSCMRAEAPCATKLSDLNHPRGRTYQHNVNFNLQARINRDSISRDVPRYLEITGD